MYNPSSKQCRDWRTGKALGLRKPFPFQWKSRQIFPSLLQLFIHWQLSLQIRALQSRVHTWMQNSFSGLKVHKEGIQVIEIRCSFSNSVIPHLGDTTECVVLLDPMVCHLPGSHHTAPAGTRELESVMSAANEFQLSYTQGSLPLQHHPAFIPASQRCRSH